MMRTTSWGILDLAPDGVYKHPALQLDLVVSYTTFSPLSTSWWTVYFLLHFPSPHLRGPPVRRHPVLRCSDFPLSISQAADWE